MTERACTFSETIRKAGINPCVDVPEHVSVFFGKRSYVPVVGLLNDTVIRATLVPVGGGRHRLYINGEMRKKANVYVGDKVHLNLMLDSEPRNVTVPKELAEALQKNERARAIFQGLRPSRRNEILAYLNYLKKPESLRRNVKKVIKLLEETEEKKTKR
jgi:hypothetical protein